MRVVLNVLLSVAIGLVIGYLYGLATGKMSAGGKLAAILMIALGVTTGIRETVKANKPKSN